MSDPRAPDGDGIDSTCKEDSPNGKQAGNNLPEPSDGGGGSCQPPIPKRPRWDVFKQQPVQETRDRDACIRRAQKVVKVLVIILFFVLFIFGFMVNKAAIFMATSQLNPTYVVTCVGYGNASHPRLATSCVAHAKGTELNPYSLYCADFKGLQPETVGHDVALCPSVHIRWLWCIIWLMVIPYLCIIVRNIWLLIFKHEPSPRRDVFVVSMIVDTISTVGLCTLVFRVLPNQGNTFKGLCVLLGLSVVPSFLLMLNKPAMSDNIGSPVVNRKQRENMNNTSPDQKIKAKQILVIILNVMAFIAQLSCLLMWPIHRIVTNPNERFNFELPLSILMVSLGWWENYADPNWNFHPPWERCTDQSPERESFLQSMREAKVKLSLAGTIWKIFVTFSMAVMLHMNDYTFSDWFTFTDNTLVECLYLWNGHVDQYAEILNKVDSVILLSIGVGVAVVMYFLVRAVAKIRIQAATMGLASLLAAPLMLTSMMLICNEWTKDACFFHELRPLHLFWSCDEKQVHAFLYSDYGWVSFFWWASQVWVTRHIWTPTAARLAKSKDLFVNPLVDAILLGPWVLHNRRRIDYTEGDKKARATSSAASEDEDVVPMIYMCATLWHENKAEMMEILKSLFRNDLEQFKRKLFKDTLMLTSYDYFEFEAHVFFDDAMTLYDHPNEEHTINDFVKMFVNVMDEAASAVHRDYVHVEGPTRYDTPYGGRLEWLMPGENKLVVHLKDKNKIRHKKRWSQVMYMYYLLGFSLMNKMHETSDTSGTKRRLMGDNTYILALDGDVEFKPDAVHKLVDLMKKDKKVGAACGRIHPVGAGPMVWYQLFEYAIGHWLQKSTEHVLGSVLCSPGCFSLFRASALMDTNVARTYATMPTEAKHYIQYDQGEDRWLCTLLIQQGYRVEYSAASDAYTFVPEGFNEFFTQRRRWMPSTMANIIDLLVTWRPTIKKNDNISLLYMIYQAVLLLASILGSGTIFLMIVGALKITTKDAITLKESFIMNLVPLVIFLIICYVCKSEVQLFVAAVLSTAYSLIQMVVLVGIIIQISNDGPSSPNAVFFFFVSGTFILAALLHPQEWFCVIHGFIYFLAVPSMYMLLMMYALTNLHVISWGTREVKQTPTEMEEEQTKKAMEEAKKAKKRGIPFVNLGSAAANTSEEGFTLSLGNLCRCVCCPREEANRTTRDDGIQRLELAIQEVKLTLDQAVTNNILGDLASREEVQALNTTDTRSKKLHRSKSSLSTAKTTLHEIPQNVRSSRVSLPSATATSDVIPETVQRTRFSLPDATVTPPVFPKRILRSRSRVSTASWASNICDDYGISYDEVFGGLTPEEAEPKRDWIDDPTFVTGEKSSLPEEEEVFFKELIATYLEPIPKDKKREEKVHQELIELRNKMSGTYLLLNAIFVIVVFTLQINVETVHVHWPWGQSKDGTSLLLEPVGLVFLTIFGAIMLLQLAGMISHRTTTFQHILATTTLPCKKQDYDGKQLQEVHRETIFDSLMYRKDSIYKTLYEDDNLDKKPIKIKTSSDIAARYRQKLTDFTNNSTALAEDIPPEELKRTASLKKRQRAFTYIMNESKAPGVVQRRTQSRAASMSRQKCPNNGVARVDVDVELGSLPPEQASGTRMSDTESIGPCSIHDEPRSADGDTSRATTPPMADMKHASGHLFTTDL